MTLAPFVHPLRVRYAECDPQQIVFNANYFAYFDVAMKELRRAAMGRHAAMLERGVDMVVAEASARFLGAARFDDELEFEVSITRLGRTACTTRHRVLREREERERREANQTLTIAGDGAMVGLLEKLAAAYHEAGFKTGITVSMLANSAGIAAVAEGDYDIGLSARDPIPGVDPAGLVFTKIAREGICVITNDENPITNMTEETVEGIFAARLTDWNEVPGAFVMGPIALFDYEPSVPTQEAFQSIFLGEFLEISPGATSELSEELTRNAVAGDHSGIGFVRIGRAVGVSVVSYEGARAPLKPRVPMHTPPCATSGLSRRDSRLAKPSRSYNGSKKAPRRAALSNPTGSPSIRGGQLQKLRDDRADSYSIRMAARPTSRHHRALSG